MTTSSTVPPTAASVESPNPVACPEQVVEYCTGPHNPELVNGVVSVMHEGPKFGPIHAGVYKAYDGALTPQLIWIGPVHRPFDNSLTADATLLLSCQAQAAAMWLKSFG